MTKQCEKVVNDAYWGSEVVTFEPILGSCELVGVVNYITGVAPMVAGLVLAVVVIVGLVRS